MADTADIIKKLMALALNNPNEEEARSAALKAVQLITEHNIPLGIAGPVKAPGKAWTVQEEADFKETLVSMVSRRNPDEFTPATTYPSFDIDDGFMKKRIIEAWRQIRIYRQQIETEYRRLKWVPPTWK